MSTTIQIYGASDDLIEIEGSAPGCDEYNEEDAAFLVTGTSQGAPAQSKVRAIFNHEGLWSITVSQAGEDIRALPCVIDTDHERPGYTVVASFDDVTSVQKVAL